LSQYLLKKQCLFAYKLEHSRYYWQYAEDNIHLMHQHARLVKEPADAADGEEKPITKKRCQHSHDDRQQLFKRQASRPTSVSSVTCRSCFRASSDDTC